MTGGGGYDDRVRDILRDLVDFAALGAGLVAKGRAAYDADVTIQLAGEAVCHRLGEAVARLGRVSPAFLASHREIDWSALKGMRDIVAHQYERVDHRILWNALAVDLPRDAAIMEQWLRN